MHGVCVYQGIAMKNEIFDIMTENALTPIIYDKKIVSCEKNEQNTPYFEFSIENDEYITYSINLSKNKVFVQNFPTRDKRDLCVLFRVLRIDLKNVQNAINNGSNDISEVISCHG